MAPTALELEIDRLQECVIGQGLVTHEWLDSLFSALPPEYRATLPVPSAPAQRLEQSLARLLESGTLTDGTIPLAEVAGRLALEPQREVVDAAKRLRELLLRNPPSSSGRLPPVVVYDGPPTVKADFTWVDRDDGRWRVEESGTRCPACVTVRVTGKGAEVAPTFAWRRRRLLGRGAWTPVALDPIEDGEPGVTTWRATTSLQTGTIRAWRLDAKVSAGDQHVKRHGLAVPRNGVRAAISILLALIAFTAIWLVPLPRLAVVLAAGALVATVGAGVLRGLLRDTATRGPLVGIGTLEWMTVIAAVGAALVMILPPLAMIIVQNQTAFDVEIITLNKQVVKFVPGEGRTLMAWDSELNAIKDRTDLCVCPTIVGSGCLCESESVRFVTVRHVKCRLTRWEGSEALAAADNELSGAARLDGAVFLATDKACKPLGGSATVDLAMNGASVSSPMVGVPPLTHPGPPDPGGPDAGVGTHPPRPTAGTIRGALTVNYPWTRAATPLRLTNLETTRLAVTGPPSEVSPPAATPPGAPPSPTPPKPWLEIKDLAVDGVYDLPAIGTSWSSFEVTVGSGTLACGLGADTGAGLIELRKVGAPDQAEVVLTRGERRSSWTGPGPAYACRIPSETFKDALVTVKTLVPGDLFKLPPNRAATVRAREGKLGPVNCVNAGAGDQMSIIKVERPIDTPLRLHEAEPGTRTWDVTPVALGDRSLALLCDPPKAPLMVLDANRGRYELRVDGLRRTGDVRPPVTPTPFPRPTIPAVPLQPRVPDEPCAGRTPCPPIQPTHRVTTRVCMVGPDGDQVTFLRECPITRPGDPTKKCRAITDRRAQLVARRQVAAGKPCSSVCLCD